MRLSFLFAPITAAILVASLRPACAQAPEEGDGGAASGSLNESPESEVEAVYVRAKRALDEERYDDAARDFQQGYSLAEPGPMRWRMALGMALSHELDDELASAAEYYALFLERSADHAAASSPKWKARRERATGDLDELLDKLSDTHARIRLETVPAGAAVTIDGRDAPTRPTPATFVLPAGERRIRLQLAGYETQTVDVSLEAAERIRVQRVLERLGEPVPTPLAPRPAPTPTLAPAIASPAPVVLDDGTDALTIGGFVSLGAGAASLALAGVFTAVTASTVDELRGLREPPVTEQSLVRDRELRDRLAWLQPTYATLYVVGGLAMGTGLVLVLLPEDDDDQPSTVSLRLSPVGMGVTGSF